MLQQDPQNQPNQSRPINGALPQTAGLLELDAVATTALIAGSPIPVLVDFSSPGCGPCRAMEPVLRELANEFAGRVAIVKVDLQQSPAEFAFAQSYHVSAIPTLVLFNAGKELSRTVGLIPKAKLQQTLSAVA